MPIPPHLQPYVKPGSLHRDARGIEHRFTLAADGTDCFRIRYYGTLYENLITDTDFAPAKITAVAVASGREILLFDGCRHGYNAMLCDEYSAAQHNDRPLQDLDAAPGQIGIRLYYNIDYEEERDDFADGNGNVALTSGETIPFARLQQDGFDAIAITLTAADGKQREILNAELA
ncbi:hypothetical protein [uncultured Cardiobacterium sp.]|uniref:hypothetical protein n=1 Tax=uncultured Cardiobacterium sp. TaxID=417619 RepID=UPI00261B9A20|nr:hypothetical protein [uncultured Cardiobacterium sp.]